MESRNLDRALDIVSKLINGENVGENGDNAALYQEYSTNAQVYDIVMMTLKKMNLDIYEYKNSLYVKYILIHFSVWILQERRQTVQMQL